MRVFVALLIVGLSLLSAFWLRNEPLPAPGRPPTATPVPELDAKIPTPRPTRDERAPSTEEAALPAADPLSETLCPPGMAWIRGDHCAASGQDGRCRVPLRPVAVCMDEFEYPNQVGVHPAVMLDVPSAKRLCAAEGKRMCLDAEWTFACRSTRQAAACNAGRTEKVVRVQHLQQSDRVSEELAAQDGRRRSDVSACVSDSRVFDLLGNVQEWVQSEHQTAYAGALKGGRYNQSLISCERSIQVKDQWARYPHTGVRCCADPLVELPGLK